MVSYCVRGRLAPRVRGDLSGVHVAGVRRDDGDGRFACRRHGVLEDRVEYRVQCARVGRVELARDRRLAHALAALADGANVASAREGHRQRDEGNQPPARLRAQRFGGSAVARADFARAEAEALRPEPVHIHTPAIFCPQYSQAPFFRCISLTKKFSRRMTAFLHDGQ